MLSRELAKKCIRDIVRANYHFTPETMPEPAEFIEAKVEYTYAGGEKSIRTLVLNRAPMGEAELVCVGVLARKSHRIIFLDTQLVIP